MLHIHGNACAGLYTDCFRAVPSRRNGWRPPTGDTEPIGGIDAPCWRTFRTKSGRSGAILAAWFASLAMSISIARMSKRSVFLANWRLSLALSAGSCLEWLARARRVRLQLRTVSRLSGRTLLARRLCAAI